MARPDSWSTTCHSCGYVWNDLCFTIFMNSSMSSVPWFIYMYTSPNIFCSVKDNLCLCRFASRNDCTNPATYGFYSYLRLINNKPFAFELILVRSLEYSLKLGQSYNWPIIWSQSNIAQHSHVHISWNMLYILYNSTSMKLSVFNPLAFQTEGVLSLPASVLLSVHLSVNFTLSAR